MKAMLAAASDYDFYKQLEITRNQHQKIKPLRNSSGGPYAGCGWCRKALKYSNLGVSIIYNQKEKHMVHKKV